MTVINTNTSALRAANASMSASKSLSTSMERLSTGKRINSAKDDAAGLSIATRMSSQIKSMNMAIRNANDGISLAQTAEGALSETTNMLSRMKELATQAANGTLQSSDRASLQAEMNQLVQEIGNVASNTSFNGVKLLNGDTSTIRLQTGTSSGDAISVSMVDTRAASLGLSKTTGAIQSGGTLNLNNVTGAISVKVNGATVDATSNAKDVAKAVSSGSVTATAANSIKLSYTAPAAGTTPSITINGTTVTLAAGDTADQAITKINSALAAAGTSKGLTVSNDGGAIKLSTGGEDISVTTAASAVFTGGFRTDGTTAITTAQLGTGVAQKGTVTLNTTDASNKIAVEDGVDGGSTNLAALNITDQTTRSIAIDTLASASAALSTIDTAINQVSAGRGNLGAVQNRLESTVNNLTTTSTNLSDAKSRIEDADFSTESTNLAKAQILSQASTAMLAQANQSAQGVLKLLG